MNDRQRECGEHTWNRMQARLAERGLPEWKGSDENLWAVAVYPKDMGTNEPGGEEYYIYVISEPSANNGEEFPLHFPSKYRNYASGQMIRLCDINGQWWYVNQHHLDCMTVIKVCEPKEDSE